MSVLRSAGSVRALTVRQPWAWAIAAGAKDVENRSAGFPTAYRGTVLVHAALETWAGDLDPASPAHRELVHLRTNGPQDHPARSARGAVVAVTDLVDVHPDLGCCRPWGESAYTADDGRPRRGVVHLVLEDTRRLAEPVPCRGALGLWRPTPETLAAVEVQVR